VWKQAKTGVGKSQNFVKEIEEAIVAVVVLLIALAAACYGIFMRTAV